MKKKFNLRGSPHLIPKKLITALKIVILLFAAGISFSLTTPAYAIDPPDAQSQQITVRGTITDSQTG
jgi:capsular polysaccharide biosynthesis protein